MPATIDCGKYYVLATYDPVDRSIESMANIWRERKRGAEVDVGPQATATVPTLDAISLQPQR